MPAIIDEIRISPWGTLLTQMGQGAFSFEVTATLSAAYSLAESEFYINCAAVGPATSVGVLYRPGFTTDEEADHATTPLLNSSAYSSGRCARIVAAESPVPLNNYTVNPTSGSDNNPSYSPKYWDVGGWVSVRAYANSGYSSEIERVRLPGLATVVTGLPDVTGSTTATVSGAVSYAGQGYRTRQNSIPDDSLFAGGGILEWGVVGRIDALPTTSSYSFKYTDAFLTGSAGSIPPSNLNGLTPGATYWVRAYARNAYGTAYGNVYLFKGGVGVVQMPHGKDSGTGLGLGFA